ncbi:putative holin-like toxin [Halobacillus sp. ACCC02827]|nr:putative holin-like toxin [Halobacillus sp. ACCC02827]WJE17064.1 putative holin-like toxin [Halobacillus sp. ACCC02827]
MPLSMYESLMVMIAFSSLTVSILGLVVAIFRIKK